MGKGHVGHKGHAGHACAVDFCAFWDRFEKSLFLVLTTWQDTQPDTSWHNNDILQMCQTAETAPAPISLFLPSSLSTLKKIIQRFNDENPQLGPIHSFVKQLCHSGTHLTYLTSTYILQWLLARSKLLALLCSHSHSMWPLQFLHSSLIYNLSLYLSFTAPLSSITFYTLGLVGAHGLHLHQTSTRMAGEKHSLWLTHFTWLKTCRSAPQKSLPA